MEVGLSVIRALPVIYILLLLRDNRDSNQLIKVGYLELQSSISLRRLRHVVYPVITIHERDWEQTQRNLLIQLLNTGMSLREILESVFNLRECNDLRYFWSVLNHQNKHISHHYSISFQE